MEFRQQYGVDSTLVRDWSPPEVLIEYIPGGFFGEDREGHPVWHSNMGNLDIKGSTEISLCFMLLVVSYGDSVTILHEVVL